MVIEQSKTAADVTLPPSFEPSVYNVEYSDVTLPPSFEPSVYNVEYSDVTVALQG